MIKTKLLVFFPFYAHSIVNVLLILKNKTKPCDMKKKNKHKDPPKKIISFLTNGIFLMFDASIIVHCILFFLFPLTQV